MPFFFDLASEAEAEAEAEQNRTEQRTERNDSQSVRRGEEVLFVMMLSRISNFDGIMDHGFYALARFSFFSACQRFRRFGESLEVLFFMMILLARLVSASAREARVLIHHDLICFDVMHSIR